MLGPEVFSDKVLKILKAPGGSDEDTLELSDDRLHCPSTDEVFPFIRGIPALYKPTPWEQADITNKVRTFYEEHPFPSYEGLEDFGELVSKGNKNAFTRTLLKSIGYNKLILECGCGTGQLTNFLQLNNNHTLGIDLSLSSLALAMEHKQRNQLARSAFAQMNIFELAVKDAAFDVVISHGVLHHTFDARRAFAQIVKKAKPGGIVVIGLYNYIARIPTWIRAKLIKILGPRIDFVVRTRIHDARKAEIWIKDQYYNPHETWHSIDEVIEWFEESDVEVLNVNPSILGTEFEDRVSLFAKHNLGTRPQRIFTQIAWLATISREGALFDLIGRRKCT